MTVGRLDCDGWTKFASNLRGPNKALLNESIDSLNHGSAFVLARHEGLYSRDLSRKGTPIRLGNKILPARDDTSIWRPGIVDEQPLEAAPA